ncbi:RDD family protein [Planctomycetota bacterium]
MNTSTTIPSMPVVPVNDLLTLASPCSVRQVRPWIRYFARIVDIFLFSLLIGIMLGMFAPSVLNLPNAFLTMIILFAWIFQESILLANCGTTVGKWFFKIKVRNCRGQKLTFSDALNRSFGVWLKGMGAGVPLLNLISLLASRSNLKRNGITAWDEEGGFIVTHGKIGFFRPLVAAMLFFGFCSLSASINTVEEREDIPMAYPSIEQPTESGQGIATRRHDDYKVKREAVENASRELMAHIQDEIWDYKVNNLPYNDRSVTSDKSNKADDLMTDVDTVISAAGHTDADNVAEEGDFETFVGLAEQWLENQSDL